MSASRIVVDTNVISYIFKGDTRGPAYERLLEGQQLILPFQVRAELEEWMNSNNWGEQQRERLRNYLGQYVLIHSDERLVTLWGQVRSACQKAGRRIDPADAWVAATALALRCPLVTHNADDFAGVPNLKLITLLDPTTPNITEQHP